MLEQAILDQIKALTGLVEQQAALVEKLTKALGVAAHRINQADQNILMLAEAHLLLAEAHRLQEVDFVKLRDQIDGMAGSDNYYKQ